MSALLELSSIAARTLTDVTLSVAPGELVVLAGPSGAGKSTLIDVVLGLVEATGVVRLEGEELPPRERWGRVAWLGQDAGATLPAGWPVRDAVADPLRVAGVDAVDARARASLALAEVGLTQAEALRLPRALSGGQQQRVALARAIIGGARLLLLDEPSSALDEATAVALAALLRTLCVAPRGALVVSHDPAFAVALGARVAHLEGGRIVAEEPASVWAAKEQRAWQSLA